MSHLSMIKFESNKEENRFQLAFYRIWTQLTWVYCPFELLLATDLTVVIGALNQLVNRVLQGPLLVETLKLRITSIGSTALYCYHSVIMVGTGLLQSGQKWWWPDPIDFFKTESDSPIWAWLASGDHNHPRRRFRCYRLLRQKTALSPMCYQTCDVTSVRHFIFFAPEIVILWVFQEKKLKSNQLLFWYLEK